MPRKHCENCGSALAKDNRSHRCSLCKRLPVVLPVEFWEHTPLVDAMRDRNIGMLFYAYRHHPWHGKIVPQTRLSEQLGIDQAQLSRIENGHSVYDLRKLTKWLDALNVPDHLHWFRNKSEQAKEEDVDRRDVLRLASLTAASSISGLAPWSRLAHAVKSPQSIDETTVNILQKRTADSFRQEEFVTARQLSPSLSAHHSMLTEILAANIRQPLRSRILSCLGETKAIAGWIAFDLGNHREAQRHLVSAVQIAEEIGDGPLRACALGYMSYIAEAQDDAEEARRLLQEGQADVTGTGSACTRSWLAAREAETAARLKDPDSAVRALERAYTAFDYASSYERAWTSFFGLTRLGSLAVSTYVRLNHPLLVTTAQTVIDSLTPGEEKVGAIIGADLTVAATASGDYDHAEELASHAVEITKLTGASLARARLQELSRLLEHINQKPTEKLRQQLAEVV